MYDQLRLQGVKLSEVGKWQCELWGHLQDGPHAGEWTRLTKWQAYDMQHRLTMRQQVCLIFNRITRP